MNACPTREQLARLIAEDLADADRVALENHVESCLACQRSLAHMSQADESCQSSFRLNGAKKTEAAPAFLDRVKKHRPRAGSSDNLPAHPALPSVPGYEVLAEIGRGGMGVVFKALHLGVNRHVALKMLPAAHFASADSKKRFQREAQAIGRLHHANIVQIFDFGETDAGPFLSLELVKTGSLARRLDGTPWKPRDAAQLVAQLASAVQYAHEQGVIHRDLKPANILMQSESESAVPKISDFGLARCVDESIGQTPNGTVLGTPSYLAPEQVTPGNASVGPAVDVYGLGAILYELLTGAPPFRGDSVMSTLLLVTHQEPTPPSRLGIKVPRDLETICLRCLEKAPHRRYATAGQLADDLQRFLAGESIIARPPGTVERSVRWLRRNPTSAVLLLGGVLACIGIGAAALYFAWDHEQRQQDRLARQRKIERDVQSALQETQSLYDRAQGARKDLGLWTAALAAARRAEKLAIDEDAAPELRQRAEGMRADIALQEKNQRLIGRLLEIQASMGDDLLPNGDQDFPKTNARYVAAFRDYDGMDVDQLSAEACAAILRGLGEDIRVEVAASLDNWGYVRFVLKGWNAKAADPKHLHQISHLLDPDPLRNRIRAAVIQKNRKELETLAAEIDPATQSAQTLNLVGSTLYWLRPSREYAAPIDFFQRVESRHSKDFQIYHNLVFLLIEAGRGEEAVPYAFVAVANRDRSAAAWQDRADALRWAERDVAALAAHRRAAALAPQTVRHLYWAGYFLELHDKHDEAREVYREAARRVVKYAPRNTQFLTSWHEFGLADEVIAEYRQALALEPERNDIRAGLVWAMFRLGRAEYAMPWCRELVEREPANLEYQGFLGQAFGAVGDLTSASAKYRYCLEKDPKHRVAQHLNSAQRLLDLEARLPVLMLGAPLTSPDLVHLAWNKQRWQKRYREAASLYARALTAAPHLNEANAFAAATSAARAAAALGVGADKLDAKERTRLRRLALDWLNTDLAELQKSLDRNPTGAVEIESKVRLRQRDPNIVSVREPAELLKLQPDERANFTKLWQEMDALGKRAADSYTQKRDFGHLSAKKLERSFPLKMTPGTTYRIDMESPQFDTHLRLEDATNTILAENDNVSAANRNSRIVFTASAEANCRIIATSARQKGIGAYVLTVREFPPR